MKIQKKSLIIASIVDLSVQKKVDLDETQDDEPKFG